MKEWWVQVAARVQADNVIAACAVAEQLTYQTADEFSEELGTCKSVSIICAEPAESYDVLEEAAKLTQQGWLLKVEKTGDIKLPYRIVPAERHKGVKLA